MILDIKCENLKKDDIIYWDGKKWVNCKKSYFLNDLQKQINSLRTELENAKNGLNSAQKQIMELASIMKGD